MKTMVFYVDGDEVAQVSFAPSQRQRLEMLVKRLCIYAARFGYNVQFEIRD